MARKILLADDSVTAQNMGRKILADAGYEVITVNNGSAALKKIAEQKPDVIVLDVYMPGYSGLEVCQRLKEAQETSRLPILLTVGKLEPFKPEEAKRVRADGFIVKPFEASELLSALSKLEDKIVPRAETSKPGRFARVTAAIEGRYDKTVAIEEDTGWKDRIAFPSKKKKAEPEQSPADFVGSQEEKKPGKWAAKGEESRVDLGALAPEGLPKDVTPEEIAALAAAAAQVKGKMAEKTPLEPPPVPEWAKEKEQGEAAVLQRFSDSAEQVAKAEDKKIEALAAEKIDAQPERASEPAAVASANSDLMSAMAGMESTASSSQETTPEDRVSSHAAADQQANEPVTMAVARPVADGSRWTAVSVPLGPEDAAISLEHEMQKAYAAFAAVENGFAASVTASSVGVPESSDLASATTPSEPLATESIPAIPAPEVAQSLSALAGASTEALRAAVQELETVAESFVEGATSAESATASAPQAEPVSQAVEAVAKDNPEAPQEVAKEPETTEPKQQEAKSEVEDRKEESKVEEPVVAALTAQGEEVSATGIQAQDAAPPSGNEMPAQETSTSQESSPASQSSESGEALNASVGSGEVGKKESDESANTAAAWASWRRIRESGDSKESAEQKSEEAMAVAAGAEKSPADASADSESDPEAIANIVDSVLADLRPKIFEEISRKMGKKK